MRPITNPSNPQLADKLSRGELPLVEYRVFSDPGGLRTGDGGATLHVVSELLSELGEALFKRKGPFTCDDRKYLFFVPRVTLPTTFECLHDASCVGDPQGLAHPLRRLLQEDAQPQLHQQNIQGLLYPKDTTLRTYSLGNISTPQIAILKLFMVYVNVNFFRNSSVYFWVVSP